MAKISKKEIEQLKLKEQFVALYLNGTGRTKGDVEESNKVLATGFVLCDSDIRRLIAQEGGQEPVCVQNKPIEQPALPEPPQANQQELAATLIAQEEWREDLPDAEADRKTWCQKYQELDSAGVIMGAANGTVKISAAQTRIIAMISERCFGKVGDDKEAKISGVLLLPMIGTGETAMICPRCGYVHETQETNNEVRSESEV